MDGQGLAFRKFTLAEEGRTGAAGGASTAAGWAAGALEAGAFFAGGFFAGGFFGCLAFAGWACSSGVGPVVIVPAATSA